MICNCCC